MAFSAEQALERAVRMAQQSPCQKSKRGVVIWHPDAFDILCANHNGPPRGFSCNGSEECRANCGKYCVHAEMAAILDAKTGLWGYHMLHVKVLTEKQYRAGRLPALTALNTSSRPGSVTCGFYTKRVCEGILLRNSTNFRFAKSNSL